MITVETTDNDIRVIIPKDEIPADRLNVFLDQLRLESAAQRSNLSEEAAEAFAENFKSSWWAANKNRFIK